MNDYVALIHLNRPAICTKGGPSDLASAAAIAAGACRKLLPAISDTASDSITGSLVIRFDRARSTLADIVRCLEDHGVAIAGVSQSPADDPAVIAAV